MSATPPTQPQDASGPEPEGVSPEPQPKGSSLEPQPDATTPEATTADPQPEALLRILTRGATDEEVAALVAVVSAIATDAASSSFAPVPTWSAHQRKVQPTYPHGPGAWRASGLPR